MKGLFAVSAATLALCAGVVLAQNPPARIGAGAPPPDMPGPMARMLPLKRADVAQLVATHFAALDANHDGAVTEAEIRAFRHAQAAAMMKAHRDAAFAMLDTNHDGSLSRQEFDAPARSAMPDHGGMPGGPPPVGAGAPPPAGEPGGPPPGGPDGPGMRDRRGPPPMAGMMIGRRWFERADANQDGKVTLAEAQAAALAMFDKADTNHDGTLTREEAGAVMRARMGARMGRHGPGGPPPPPPPPPAGA